MKLGGKHIFKKEGDGDFYLNATIKEYWEAKLETCDQKSAEKVRCRSLLLNTNFEVIKN